MRTYTLLASSGVLLLGLTSAHSANNVPHSEDAVAFFEKKVRPILVSHCYSCHSADTKPSGGLRVDDRNGLLLGGDEGPAVIPGDPEKSLILQRIRHENAKKKMPKEGELLTEAEIADLTQWIKEGVAWPQERIPRSIGKIRPEYDELKKTHWAWQPLRAPAVPAAKDPAWRKTAIDQFLAAKLEAKGLTPVAEADAGTLIRRVTYDLTGLPPTPEAVERFTQDHSPGAFANLVDELLDSREFAAHWGRHWLDVARYGESTGPSRNIPYPHAWRYRDYVIDSIAQDVPYDRFLREQIAGDLLPAKETEERDRLLTATGFLALGVKDVNQRFKTRFVMDNVDEKIDTVSRSVLGLTVSCARCHDHKFDPIPVTDYYALAGIFTSTEDCAGVRNKMGGGGLDYYDPKHLIVLGGDLPPVPPEQIDKLQKEVAAAKEAFEEIRGTPEGLKPAADGRPTQRAYRVKLQKLQGDLLALSDPGSRGHAVHGVRDAADPSDTEVRIRGEAERLGPTVPRGFLSTFEVPGSSPVNPGQSGRLELANWLTSPNNPLTARVIANRVWQHLFGEGIVTTVDNFGINGDVPSHPELLDHLATQFIHDGWSLKRLIRAVVLTRAYRLGSDAPEANLQADPANRLVWRHSPRRLSAEEMRDSLIASAGRLAPPPSASPSQKLKMIEMRDNGVEARGIHQAADRGSNAASTCRCCAASRPRPSRPLIPSSKPSSPGSGKPPRFRHRRSSS
jgi:cytochrome c553